MRSEPFLRSWDSATLGSLSSSSMFGVRWRLLILSPQENGLRSAATAMCVLHGVEAMSLLSSASTPFMISAPAFPGSPPVGLMSFFHGRRGQSRVECCSSLCWRGVKVCWPARVIRRVGVLWTRRSFLYHLCNGLESIFRSRLSSGLAIYPIVGPGALRKQ
jgi:hypothetical protein